MMRLTAIPTLLAFFGASATLHVYDVLSERALPLRVISIRSPMNIITKIGLKLLKNKKEKPRRYDCTYLYGAGRQIISFFRKREVAPPYNILAYHDTVWRLG